MGPISPFLRPHDRFDAKTLALLNEAFVKAMAKVHGHHLPPPVRKVVAGNILKAASTGERNIEVLCEAALKAFRYD
jgi:hypothetical protein